MNIPTLPKSWSELSWRQLCDVWACKVRYGGNADVARAAALLALCGLEPARKTERQYDPVTGERRYMLVPDGGSKFFTLHSSLFTFAVTPRELSQMARQALPWFDYPYGDPGREAVRDDRGKVVEEAVAPVRGYVSEMRDAMILPEQELVVDGVLFSLPQMACNNLTWQQYRSLQALAPMLFQEGMGDDEVLDLQAQFLAQILVPARDNSNSADRFAPRHDFTYSTERAEQTVAFWRERLKKETTAAANSSLFTLLPPEGRSVAAANSSLFTLHSSLTSVLFHICFQTYQTALTYYAEAYPLLFSDGGKRDPMRDALQGEVGTINTIMKYAGYAEQQQVYDSNLPFVLDILNTMTKEAKDIEQMNARIKSKR